MGKNTKQSSWFISKPMEVGLHFFEGIGRLMNLEKM